MADRWLIALFRVPYDAGVWWLRGHFIARVTTHFLGRYRFWSKLLHPLQII
jgi:hypothetical protein